MLALAGNINGYANQNELPQVWENGRYRNLTSAVLKVPNYSKIFVAPDGRVFQSSPARVSSFLDTAGKGAWSGSVPHVLGVRYDGTAVFYDGKVLVIGGGKVGLVPTNSTELIDLNAASPAWHLAAPMANPRRHANATLLPDGKALVTGGSKSPENNNAAGAILATEMWDPATASWTTMPSLTIPRIYHSAALLLPDGRVLVAGGSMPTNSPALTYKSAQIYSPGYLYRGARPTIASAPDQINYGQTMLVLTPDAAAITQVRFIRLSSTTHSYNMSQLSQTAAFTPIAGGLAVAVPSNANLLPRGYYMLFILNDAGVPSIAKIVNIGGEIDGLRYIAAYSDLLLAFGSDEVAGQQHYQAYGRAEGRDPFSFNPAQYLANLPRSPRRLR